MNLNQILNRYRFKISKETEFEEHIKLSNFKIRNSNKKLIKQNDFRGHPLT